MAEALSITTARESHAAAGWERWSFFIVFTMLGCMALLLLVAPTIVVLITSFTDGYTLKFPPPGYSMRWYRELLHSSALLETAYLSLKIASAATGISVLLGVSAALVLSRRKDIWARMLDTIFMSPLMLPLLALGLALLVLFSRLGIELSMITLIIGHVVITTPYIIRTTAASYVQVDAGLLESAKVLGARPWFAFRTVTLPLIAPGIAAGAFIAFMASFDNVTISLFLADARHQVLPIRLWTIMETNLDVRAAAVSGVLIVLTIALALLMERLAGLTKYMR